MRIINVNQGSNEWHLARIEKVSGTKLCSVLGTPAVQETLINKLIAEHLTGQSKESFQSPAMSRGIEAEDYAIREYERKTGVITDQVGICVSDKYPWLMNSPDRLVETESGYTKAVEVKSPDSETAVKYIRDNKIPKEYLGQVLSYFLVNEKLEELDFVIYDPRIKKQKYRLYIIKVTRKELREELQKAEEKLIKFREKWEEALTNFTLNF